VRSSFDAVATEKAVLSRFDVSCLDSDPESRFPNPESRFPIPESRFPNPEPRIPARIGKPAPALNL